MNKKLEKVLLLIGLEHDREFYRECNLLLEEAEKNPSQFTGAELVVIHVLLKEVLAQVAKHSAGLIPDFEHAA